MSDIDKEFEARDKAIIDECLKLMSVKAVATRKHKASCLYTRREIEDILEFTALQKESELYV